MLEKTVKNNDVYFKITGEIDHHSVKSIKEIIDTEIIMLRPPKIYLDLSEVSFMDSSGLGLILGRYQISKKICVDFAVYKPSDAVYRIIKMSGCDKFIKIIGKKEAI